MTPVTEYQQRSTLKLTNQTRWDRLVKASVLFLEFLPLVVVIMLGFLLGMSPYDLFMHALGAASTISLVHCIGTIRHVSAAIHQCNTFKNLAHRMRDDALFDLYDQLLEQKLSERVIFWFYTAATVVFWIGNASCYVAYLAEHHRETPVFVIGRFWLGFFAMLSATATVVLATLKVWAVTRTTPQLGTEYFVYELESRHATDRAGRSREA